MTATHLLLSMTRATKTLIAFTQSRSSGFAQPGSGAVTQQDLPCNRVRSMSGGLAITNANKGLM